MLAPRLAPPFVSGTNLQRAQAKAFRQLPSSASTTRRIARRRGAKKAIVWSILVIICPLSDLGVRYTGLSAGFYRQRNSPERRKRINVRQVEALGYRVPLEPTA